MSATYSVYVKNKDQNLEYFIGQENIYKKTIYSPKGVYELLLKIKEDKLTISICSCYDDETREKLFGDCFNYEELLEVDLFGTVDEDREFYLNKILDFDFDNLDFVEKDISIECLLGLAGGSIVVEREIRYGLLISEYIQNSLNLQIDYMKHNSFYDDGKANTMFFIKLNKKINLDELSLIELDISQKLCLDQNGIFLDLV